MKGKIKDPYWEQGQWTLTVCDKCGEAGRKKVYHKYFVPVSWFRGDDELKKTLCHACYKERNNILREQSKEARLIIEQAGYGDIVVVGFDKSQEPARAWFRIRDNMVAVLNDNQKSNCYVASSKAGKLLLDYGWEVSY